MDTKGLFKKTVVFTVITSFLFWNFAWAAPDGGQVVAGSAAISQSANTTTINQSSSSAVINWNNFNTNINESVNFIQPSSSAVALNRITSGTPTTFAGQLTANGQVWILNPAGVLFTSTSKIDVGGLVATTLNISDNNFMNKNYALSQSPNYPQSSVINNGLITAHENGLVALVAPTVENNGVITANMGNVLLASGTVATLDPYGDNLIQFAPNNYAVEGSVSNTGTISANGGKVVMAANSVNKIIKDVVNNGGFIEANNAVESSNGVIILGGNSGTTNIGGKIASNKIIIKGHDTVISGELKTQDGGMIETSGETISITSGAIIDAGKGGLWYLDPLTINISDYNGLVQSRLQAGTNVTLSTGTNLSIAGTGDINVDQAISWNSSAVLFLAAYRNINISQPMTSTGGTVIMRSDMANNHTGNVIFSGAAAGSGANVMNGGGGVVIYYNPASYASPTNYAQYFSGSTPITGYMMVDNLTDLNNIAANPNGNYSLNADIDRGGSNVSIFGQNVYFNGIFNGYDYATGITHTIYNFYVFDDGGFASANFGTIANVNFSGTVQSNGTGVILGGVVSANVGTIYNVTFTGNIFNVPSGSTASNLGGIVGGNTGTLYRVGFNGSVIQSGGSNAAWSGGIAAYMFGSNASIQQSYSVNGVLGAGPNGEIGGLVGRLIEGNIGNSYTTMFVNGSGASAAGGLVGHVALNSSSASIGDSYYNGYGSNMGTIYGLITSSGSTSFGGGDIYYNSDTCTSCTVSAGSQARTTAQMNIASNFALDFGNIWTTNGNTTPPLFIPLPQNPIINTVLGSGNLSVASSQAVSIYANGTLQSTVNSDASGGFAFSYDPNIDFSSQSLLATTNATVKGTILKTASSTTPITGLNITNNQVRVDSTVAFSNANLAAATVNTPYTAVGNNLTLSSGVEFLTTSTTPFTLNGNITTSGGAGISFGNTVTLGANSVLNGNGNIDFNDTVDGAFNLTANSATGAVTFDAAVGGTTPLSGLTVVTTSAFVPADLIKVSGVSSFSAGANVIDLSNVNNIFGGVITLNNSGNNNVDLTNTVATVLAASLIGGEFTVTSGGAISQTGPLTVGGESSFDAAANAITLTNPNNSFNGPITFHNTGINNVNINNTAATILAASSTDGTLTVTSGGAITQTGAITVGGASNFSAGANAITLTDTSNDFGGSVTLSNSGSNDVQIYNDAALTLTPFTVGGNLIVSTSGGVITLSGSNSSGGSQTYNAPLVLGSATNLTAIAGNIDFTNTIAGAGFNLTTNTSLPYRTEIHGDITNVNILTVNGDVDINANVSTIGAQTYNGLVTLTTNANLINTTGNIDFVYAIDGAGYNLSTTTVSPFTTVFDGPVTNVNNLTVTGSADINGGLISTTGNQIYDGVVNLGANTSVSSSGGDIHFMDDINGGGFDLSSTTVNPYATIFDGNINNVDDLTVSGAATFNNATAITASGTVSFDDALNGPGSVVITAADTQISGSVGGVPPLSAFTVNGPVEFDGGIINAATQTYNGLVTILSSLNPTELNASGLIHFTNNVEGPGSLTIVAGTLQFDGSVGAITPLDVLDIPAPVTLNGSSSFNANTQNFRGPVTVIGSTVINSNGTVHFFDTIDGPGSLTVDAVLTQIDGVVGGTTPLSLLDIINAIVLNGANITANQAIFEGPATIGPNGAVITSPDVEFLSTINGPGGLSIIGNLTASGDINIGGLFVTGTTLFNKGSDQNVTTVLGQNYGDTVTLNNNLNIVNTGSGVINFGGGGVDGPAYNLSVFNYSGLHVDGITGSVNVFSLILGGTGGATLTNSTIGAGGLTVYFASIGSFCVNGSCQNSNLDISQKIVMPIIPELYDVVCDTSGCRDAYILLNVPNLLKVSDPLEGVCVVGTDGKVSCVSGSASDEYRL